MKDRADLARELFEQLREAAVQLLDAAFSASEGEGLELPSPGEIQAQTVQVRTADGGSCSGKLETVVSSSGRKLSYLCMPFGARVRIVYDKKTRSWREYGARVARPKPMEEMVWTDEHELVLMALMLKPSRIQELAVSTKLGQVGVIPPVKELRTRALISAEAGDVLKPTKAGVALLNEHRQKSA